jgi:hypothetical protein
MDYEILDYWDEVEVYSMGLIATNYSPTYLSH